tara:strand:+ start:394 stop:687 length:294 start_codon:yes stop_codon:yes gene_type:complete
MSIILTILISLLIIYLADTLIQYFKNTYTNKISKDVVGHHIHKYQSLMQEFQENNNKEKTCLQDQINELINNEGEKLTSNDLLSMNEELDALINESV